MSRPSVKAERCEEILDAYERCIARYGVEGATLEKTAEEAGLARALIRHNVGNKDDLLDAFIHRFLGGATKESASLFAELPRNNRVSVMLDLLFDAQHSDAHEVSVTNALITAANDRPPLARRLRRWILDFVADVEKELNNAFPHADNDKTDAVAAGIVSIYFTVDGLTPLGRMSELRKSSEAAARLLVSTLDEDT